jgi:hypothetical protein
VALEVFMSHNLRIYDKRGIVALIFIIIVVGLLAIALISLIEFQKPQSPIKIHNFEVQPSEFKLNENGILVVEVENLNSNNPTSVTMYFETTNNAQIYKGNSLLPKNFGNYTFTKQFDPRETSILKFTLKGKIDVGDNSRDYYVKVYCYIEGKCYSVQTALFTIKRS